MNVSKFRDAKVQKLRDEWVRRMSDCLANCFRVLGKCYVTSILDLWDYDTAVIETLTEEEIRDKINTVRLK